jgi:hypothetical protein
VKLSVGYKARMPLYFFDVTDNGSGLPDTEGTELADLEAARQEALATLGEIARDKLPDGDRREFVIKIRDGDTSLMRATLSLVVQRF